LGKTKTVENEQVTREGSVGICINGSDSSESFTNSRAITVYTLGETYDSRVSRVILGKIPDDATMYGRIAGTYGLYGENVYLKGSLVTEAPDSQDNATYCGISTAYSKNEDIPTMNTDNGKTWFGNERPLGNILFWAGAAGVTKEDIEEAKFKVDEYGNMYAGSGYFDGSILTNATIEAAKIKTAIIEGTGNKDNADDKFGLII
jgi:hypothetical protein